LYNKITQAEEHEGTKLVPAITAHLLQLTYQNHYILWTNLYVSLTDMKKCIKTEG